MITLTHERNKYIFYWRGEKPEPEPDGSTFDRSIALLFVSESQGMEFLRRFPQLWDFRQLLARGTSVNPSGWGPEQILKALASHLRTQRLRIEKRWEPAPTRTTYHGEPLVVPRKEVVEKAPEQEPSTFPSNHDAPAQSETLAAAAEEGAPFCEECEKARLAAEAGNPPPPAAPSAPAPKAEPAFAEKVDAAAQAKTLTDASKEGVPFCEECEKARQAA